MCALYVVCGMIIYAASVFIPCIICQSPAYMCPGCVIELEQSPQCLCSALGSWKKNKGGEKQPHTRSISFCKGNQMHWGNTTVRWREERVVLYDPCICKAKCVQEPDRTNGKKQEVLFCYGMHVSKSATPRRRAER